MRKPLLFCFLFFSLYSNSQPGTQFTNSMSTSWLLPANWSSLLVPGALSIAEFGTLPSGSGSNNGCNINFSDITTNNGFNKQIVGAIRILPARTVEMNIGNSSSSADGTLTLNGLLINNISNVVVENQMTAAPFNINDAIVGNSRVMRLALGTNAVFAGASASKTIISSEVSSATNVELRGGTLQLTRKTGATFPATTNFLVTNGILKISSNQIVNNLELLPGATLEVDQNVTLTVNGTFKNRGASIIKGSTTSQVVFGPNAILDYCGLSAQTISTNEWQLTGGPQNVIITNTAGVTMTGARSLTGTVTVNGVLEMGNFTLTAGFVSLNNGSVVKTGSTSSLGALAGAFGTGTNLTINAGSTVELNGNGLQYISPRTFSNVTINNGGNGVVLVGNTTISGTLNLVASAKLDLAGNALNLGGTVSGTGTLKGSSASTLNLTSVSSIGNLQFDQTADGSTNALATLSISSGSAVLGSKLHLYSMLNVLGGQFDLGGKNLVLKSNAVGTARVATVLGTISNATNVTVERWFPNAGRRYRLITPGVTTTTSIRQNWMEGAMNTTFCSTCNINPTPGYGTHITGSGGNTNGFDVTKTNNASLFTYNPVTQNWVALTSTTGTLNATTPYLIFIRGDRSVNLAEPGSIPVSLPGSGTTLRTTGTLQTGTKIFSNLAADGKLSLIANPYPSAISWASIYANNSTSFQNYYTYFEPKVGQRGAYVTVSNNGLNNNINSIATDQIQSGQAFFVTTKAGVTAPSLTIREQDKSATSNINVFRAQQVQSPIEKFYISLNFYGEDGTKHNADGVLAAYGSQFSNHLDENDAEQVPGWDEDVAIVNGSHSLSIDTRSAVADNDTIQLAVARLKVQAYEWQFTPVDIAGHQINAYLIDQYTNQKTLLRLTDTTYVPFTITADSSSSAANRFLVVFAADTQVALPVTFTSVKAYQEPVAKKVLVEWQTANEAGAERFEIERSDNGQWYKKLQTVKAKGGTENSYSFLDQTAGHLAYYRIKAVEQNGAVKYSSIVVVKAAKEKSNINLYPNPVKGTTIFLQSTALVKGSYLVQLYNSTGILLQHKKISLAAEGSHSLQLDETLPPGVYQVQISGAGGTYQLSFIKK